jgi:MFS family permease
VTNLTTEKPSSTAAPLTVGSGFRAVLKNPAFLALWIGQIFSQLGDRIVFVAFVAVITQLYGSADRYTSFLYVAFTIPAILLTAIAGVFVDRWPRRAVLVFTNLLRAGLVALLPWIGHVSVWGIYALAFGISVATQFFVPAEAATIPAIVPKHQLLTANSLFTTTMMASVIFGFALGDPLISQFSLDYIHLPLTALFLLASGALMMVHVPNQASDVGNTNPSNSSSPETVMHSIQRFLAEIQEGVGYIRQNRMVFKAMIRLSILFSTIVALCVLFISFAKALLYTDPVMAARKFTYIITSSGIGMVIGAGIVARGLRHVPRGWLVEGGLTFIGIGLLFLAGLGWFLPHIHQASGWFGVTWTDRIFTTYVITGLMGMAAACVAIPLQAVIQELIPEAIRGKVMGVQFTLLSTASTLPVLLAGLGTEHFGVQSIMGGLGAMVLLLGAKGLMDRYGCQNAIMDAHW